MKKNGNTFILLSLLTLSLSAFGADRADALIGNYSGLTSEGKPCSFAFQINPYHPGEIDLYAEENGDDSFPLEFDLRKEINRQLKDGSTQSLVFHHERETMYDKTDDITVVLDSSTALPISVKATQSGLGGDTSFDCK
jgi:hypothetical protein